MLSVLPVSSFCTPSHLHAPPSKQYPFSFFPAILWDLKSKEQELNSFSDTRNQLLVTGYWVAWGALILPKDQNPRWLQLTECNVCCCWWVKSNWKVSGTSLIGDESASCFQWGRHRNHITVEFRISISWSFWLKYGLSKLKEFRVFRLSFLGHFKLWNCRVCLRIWKRKAAWHCHSLPCGFAHGLPAFPAEQTHQPPRARMHVAGDSPTEAELPVAIPKAGPTLCHPTTHRFIWLLLWIRCPLVHLCACLRNGIISVWKRDNACSRFFGLIQ